jgi:hypothetical protein
VPRLDGFGLLRTPRPHQGAPGAPPVAERQEIAAHETIVDRAEIRRALYLS